MVPELWLNACIVAALAFVALGLLLESLDKKRRGEGTMNWKTIKPWADKALNVLVPAACTGIIAGATVYAENLDKPLNVALGAAGVAAIIAFAAEVRNYWSKRKAATGRTGASKGRVKGAPKGGWNRKMLLFQR